MFSLSATTGHAIRALAYLATCNDLPVHTKDVSAGAGVPPAYLAKIIKRLNDAGLIGSKRGWQGGVWLARPASLISLLDISIALEGDDFLGTCLLGPEFCAAFRVCPTKKFWQTNKKLIRRELETIKISDVIEYQKEGDGHSVATMGIGNTGSCPATM